MKSHSIANPFSLPLHFMGPPLEEGLLPAFFYFSLSAEESLTLAPYNSPVSLLKKEKLRIFSLTIPAHGPGFDKFKAMELWSEWAFSGIDFLSDFFDECQSMIEWLCKEQVVDENHIGVGGLSRGGFVATHIAARQKKIHTLLGFSPLTTLTTIAEFQKRGEALLKKVQSFDLLNLIDDLLHLKYFRFYIGGHDGRVGTDACYFFVRALTKQVHKQKVRDLSVELRIHPSIGFQGHGTAPSTFEEGSLWMKEKLIK